MRKILVLAAGLAMAAGSFAAVEAVPRVITAGESLAVRRKKNKTARALDRFYGYASDRKGKGQKKREASARHSRGWK